MVALSIVLRQFAGMKCFFGINSLKLAVSGLIIVFGKVIRIKQKSIYLVKVRSHVH